MLKSCPNYDPYRQVALDVFDEVEDGAGGTMLRQRIENMSLDAVRSAALSRVSDKRYRVETGGLVVNGYSLSTSREHQSLLTSAAQQVRAGVVQGTVALKHQDGIAFVDAYALVIAADAVTQHVQAARQREGELWQEINAAGDVDAILAIDTDAGWP